MRPTQRSSAQGLLEFAIALSLVLLLTFGLLEFGRLLFVYAAVTTASREAVRYGSATGESSVGVPRYQDCAGIRNAAKRVAFLADLQDSDIVITYDHGPGSVAFDTCDGDIDVGVQLNNGDRVVVVVSSEYSPVVPLVPVSSFTITSTNARTVLVRISILVTDLPDGFTSFTSPPTATSTPTATNTPTPTPTPSATPTPTWTPVFSPTPSNTPTETPTPTDTSTPTPTFTPTDTPAPTSTPTSTSTPISCDVRHGMLLAFSDGISMTLYNNSPYAPVTITQIDVWFNDTDGRPVPWDRQGIASITLDGTEIWNSGLGAEGDSSPAIITTLSGVTTIDAASSKELAVAFRKTYIPTGIERLLVYFAENGCPVLDSDNPNQLP